MGYISVYPDGTAVDAALNNSPTDDQKAALNAANSPSATNAIATISDLSSLEDLERESTVDTKDISSKGGIFNGDFKIGNGSVRSNSKGWIGDESTGWNIVSAASSVEAAIENNSIRLSTLNSTGTIRVSMSPSDFYISPYTPEHRKFLIPVKPNTKYRFSYRTKLRNVIKSQIYYQTKRASDFETVGPSSSTEVLSGTIDWTYVEKIIDMGAEANYFAFTLYNEVSGNVSDAWFSDIKLEEISTATVGTEMPIPAGVQVGGVTTLDNVDQSQTVGTDNVGTVHIGSTQGQTFIPSKSLHSAVSVYGINDGFETGDISISIYKWNTDYATTIAGNIIVRSTILQADLAKGGYNLFALPCILEVGETYLYHATGTGAGDGAAYKIRGNITPDLYTYGKSYINGIITNPFADWNFQTHFSKRTKSPTVSANGFELNLDGVELLTGASITVNPDGTGKYEYVMAFVDNDLRNDLSFFHDIYDTDGLRIQVVQGNGTWTFGLNPGATTLPTYLTWKFDTKYPIKNAKAIFELSSTIGRFRSVLYSFDGITWNYLIENTDEDVSYTWYNLPEASGNVIYIKIQAESGNSIYPYKIWVDADLDCTTAQLPLVVPSDEVQSEAHDLSTHQIEISKGEYLALDCDLRGWPAHNIVMLASEALWEDQAVSAGTIYVFDSNGTTPWTWDNRNGIVPPSNRVDGTVNIKYLVGDNQILTMVNDGSMQADFEMWWDVVGIRQMVRTLYGKLNRPFNAETLDGLDSTDFVKVSDLTKSVPEIVTVPASATSSGKPGQIAYDATHIYVCVTENTWIRADLSTWV